MESRDVIVLGVKKVDFESKGDSVKGTKVFFTDEENTDKHDETKGKLPAEVWFKGFEKFEAFKNSELPGKYKMEYEIRLDGNKPKVVIIDFKYNTGASLV